MSNSIEASLRLEIAQYQQALAKAKGEANKFKADMQSGGGISKVMLGSDETWGRHRANMAAFSREMNNMSGAASGIQFGGVAMQAQDIAVQLQMGTEASIVLAQQGSQILSAFGAGGAIAGGVLAIGGAFFTMAQKSRENFDAMKADADGYAERVKEALAGSTSEISDFFTQMRSEVNVAYAEVEKLNGEGFNFNRPLQMLSGLLGGPSVEDMEQRANALALEKAKYQSVIENALLDASAKEVKLAELKAAGHEDAAKAMQHQLELQKEIQRIEKAGYSEAVAQKLIADATRKSELTTAPAKEKDKTKQQMESLKALRSEAQQMSVDMLPDQEQVAALKAQLEEVLMGARVRNIGMSIGTAADLKDVAASHRRDGNISGETEALRSYKQALTIQQDIQRLQDRITTDAKRAADLAKDKARTDMEAAKDKARTDMEAALSTKREQDDRAKDKDAWIAQRNAAVQGSADEMALLKARNTRRKSDDYRVERGIAIRSRRDSFMREEGLSAEEATARATQMRDMEEKASGTGRIRHTGIKRGMGRNLDTFFAQQGKAWGVNAPGESAFTKLQRQGFGWEKDLIPGMAGRQARNEAAQNRAPAGTSTVALSNREIEILTRIADGITGFVTN